MITRFEMRIFLSLLFLLLLIPTKGFSQFSVEEYLLGATKPAVGVGVWYGAGYFKVDSPGDSVSEKVQGYTEVIPESVSGGGFAVSFSYGSFGLSFAEDNASVDINKYVDIQGNSDQSDDPYVFSAKRVNRSVTVLFHPSRFVYVGYGFDTGFVKFDQRETDGSRKTESITYRNSFYSLSFAGGFDPTKSALAPIFTIYTKIPVAIGDFSGTTYGAGIGVYF